MNRSAMSLLLCLALPAFAADLPPVTHLAADTAFSIANLPIEPGSMADGFAVMGDTIYYAENTSESVRLNKVWAGGSASNLLPACSVQSLHREGGQLKFYDDASEKLVSYDPATGATAGTFIGRSVWNSFDTFANGNILVYAGAMWPSLLTNTQLGALPESAMKQYFLDQLELQRTAVFLLDPQFEILQKVVPELDAANITGGVDNRSEEDKLRSTYMIRMSADRSIGAVFSFYLPDILLVSPSGTVTAKLTSPGSGMVIPPGGPMPGITAYYQSDVIVGTDHLLLADLYHQLLWKVSLAGQVLARYDTPFHVIEMHRDGNLLYLRGRENAQMARYFYPGS